MVQRSEKNQFGKTDLFKLCSVLDKREAGKCLTYLIEFTSASKKCCRLYEEIFRHYKKAKFHWDQINISISDINKLLFSKPDETNTTRALRSELYKNLKLYCQFIEHQRVIKENSDKSILLDFLANRKADELFDKEYSKINKVLATKIGLNNIQLSYKFYRSYLTLIAKDQIKKSKSDYNKHYKNFSNFCIIQKIQQYCLILNHIPIAQLHLDEDIEKEIQYIFTKAKNIQEIKFLAKLYEAASLMLKNDLSNYHLLKELLEKHKEEIETSDKRFLYAFIQNFCVRSNDAYLMNEFGINHLSQFKQGLLHDGEYITLMNAKVLCTAILNLTKSSDHSIKMNKPEAEQKIKEVIKEMPPKHRKSTEYFHLAVLDYYFEDYNNTCEKLKQSPKYANAFFDFDARMVLQRCYYFLEDIDEFDKGIKNFQAALRNETDLSDEHKKAYLNFTSAINILHKANIVIDKMEKEKLLQKLDDFLQEQPVKLLAWFKEQAQLLR